MCYILRMYEDGHYELALARPTPVVRTLLITTMVMYAVQFLLDALTQNAFTREWFGLDIEAVLRHGRFWQFFTYLFLHGNLLHLLLNMLVLYFMGPETERRMGSAHFAALYFLSGVLGGVGWFLISYPGAPCVGASGSIFGILGAFATLYPRRPVTLLLFYVLPVTMEAWVLVSGLALVELTSLVLGQGGGIAYAVHVGGVLVGAVYAGIVFRWGPGFRFRRPRMRVLPGGRPAADVDRILDKIAEQGIGSLTRDERKALDEASRR
ncbi:MAG: rhomboid family intramembrane serine protease [Kiritimatiellia bacterium]